MSAADLDDLSPDASLATLCALAQLLLLMAAAGVLGGKPGPFSPAVPPAFRCRKCHSQKTRLKQESLQLVPRGFVEATGIRAICRVCGGATEFHTHLLAEAA